MFFKAKSPDIACSGLVFGPVASISGILGVEPQPLQGFVMVDHCGPDHIILRTETKRDAHHITRDQLYRLAAGILTVLAHVDYPDQK